MLFPADGTLDFFLSLVDVLNAELAEGVAAKEVARYLVFGVVDIHAHAAFHCRVIRIILIKTLLLVIALHSSL